MFAAKKKIEEVEGVWVSENRKRNEEWPDLNRFKADWEYFRTAKNRNQEKECRQPGEY